MMVWLMIVLGSTAIHVGNFHDVASCLAAAQASKTTSINETGAAAFSVHYVCIPANTGKPGDPPPPPQ